MRSAVGDGRGGARAASAAALVAGVALFVEAMYVSQHDAHFTVLLAGYGLVMAVGRLGCSGAPLDDLPLLRPT